jgi:hypothetical protein
MLENFGCCTNDELDNMTWLDNEVKTTLLTKKFQFYRQYAVQPQPNT